MGPVGLQALLQGGQMAPVEVQGKRLLPQVLLPRPLWCDSPRAGLGAGLRQLNLWALDLNFVEC